MNKRIIIIDGNSLMNRVFYALPPMNTKDGKNTNAIYGLSVILLKIIEDYKPYYIAAAFDKKAPTFRHLEYQDYKAGRKKMPDELSEQFDTAKKLLRAFNVGIYEIEGYEADDIIGTMAKKYEKQDFEVLILTGDRDSLQLVSDNTKVIFTKKGIKDIEIYDKEAIKEKYGITPIQVIDLKGLMGDASDNIPGVPGVGEKTALKLLLEYGSVEDIYNNLDRISAKKLKENLEQNKEQAFMSKKLATINCNVPLEYKLEEMDINNANYIEVKKLFEELEFKSLISKIKTDEDVETEMDKQEELKCELSYDINKLKEHILNKQKVTFYYDSANNVIIFEGGYVVKAENINDIKEVFENDRMEKNTFNAKPFILYLMKNNIKLSNLKNDLAVINYLLNPSKDYTDIVKITSESININEKDISVEKLAYFVNKLDSLIDESLKNINKLNLKDLLYDVEIPLIEVLAYMEYIGFKVNKEVLHNIGFKLSEEIDKLTVEIFELAGEEFNINSPKQLGVILFEKLGLPVIKKTKTGYSTNAEVLDELIDKHEIVSKIINYRQLVKLKSTYIDGLSAAIAKDGKIHSSFNQMVTATGRISSTEPNLQNIPIRLEQGREIRKAFEPSDNNYFILSADYSQIELRVLAHISRDENLIDAFVNGEDIHRKTASEVFNVPLDEVTNLQRSRAKAINFGIVYGLSDFGLSRDLKISRKEAKEYIDNYFSRYLGVKKYMEKVISEAKENGYVTTIMNRIRYIPEINANNRNIKMLGERLAMNTPIQGSAADIIKIAMVNVYKRLQEKNMKSRLILQVHDELVLEVDKDELEEVKQLLKYEMEHAMILKVPLLVDMKWANNWYDAK